MPACFPSAHSPEKSARALVGISVCVCFLLLVCIFNLQLLWPLTEKVARVVLVRLKRRTDLRQPPGAKTTPKLDPVLGLGMRIFDGERRTVRIVCQIPCAEPGIHLNGRRVHQVEEGAPGGKVRGLRGRKSTWVFFWWALLAAK